jgi:hypothetical protein
VYILKQRRIALKPRTGPLVRMAFTAFTLVGLLMFLFSLALDA